MLSTDERAFLWSSLPPVWAVNSNLTGTRLSLTRFFQPGTYVVRHPGRERGGRHPLGHSPTSPKTRNTDWKDFRETCPDDSLSSGTRETGNESRFNRILPTRISVLNGQLLLNSNWFWVTSFEIVAAFCSFFQLNLNNSHLTKLKNLVKNCSDLCK